MTTYPEILVARVAGVPKRRIARLRHERLARPSDWDFAGPSVGVVYSEAGLKNLLGLLGLDAAALRWPAAGEGAEGAPREPEAATAAAGAVAREIEAQARAQAELPLRHLVVTRCPINTHILFARPASGGAEVRVRVKSNVNFIPGMILLARAPAPGAEVYSHEGNSPRRRGHY